MCPLGCFQGLVLCMDDQKSGLAIEDFKCSLDSFAYEFCHAVTSSFLTLKHVVEGCIRTSFGVELRRGAPVAAVPLPAWQSNFAPARRTRAPIHSSVAAHHQLGTNGSASADNDAS